MAEDVLDIDEARHLAIDSYRQHRAAREDYRRLRRDWIKKKGSNPDSLFEFRGLPVIKDAIEAEQMYGRFAVINSNMVIMELEYQKYLEGRCREVSGDAG